jgi:Holliday junction resolvasome RuvABC endonuclease subunit
VRVGKRRANDLGKNVIKLTDQNQALDERMKTNEDELNTIVQQYSETEAVRVTYLSSVIVDKV